MKDEDIKFPPIPYRIKDLDWNVTFKEYAREAVRLNQPASPAAEPRPFNLEAAKAGAKLVTRDGFSATFITYVEDLPYPVVALIEGRECVSSHRKSGESPFSYPTNDLFLAPAEPAAPRVMWMTVSHSGYYSLYETEQIAKTSELPGVHAVKVEIRELPDD